MELEREKRKEVKRVSAETNGVDYDSDADPEFEDDPVPTLTKKMLLSAVKESKPSVTRSQYQSYLDMKKKFDSEAAGDVGFEDYGAENPSNSARDFAIDQDDESDDEELDNIYG